MSAASDPPLAPAPDEIGVPLRLRPRDYAIIAAVWGLLALVAIASRLLDPRIPGLAPQLSQAAVRITLFEYAIWFVLTPPLLWFAARLTDDEQRRLWRVLLAVLVGLVLAFAIDAAVAAMRESLIRPAFRRRRGPPPGAFGPFRFRGFGDLGFVDDLIVYLAVLFAGMARASMLRASWRQAESARLQAHATQLQLQLADARLDALRSQLDPHFLFNTLNAVSAMVERDPRGVRRMIARLSELLRHSLEETADEITLGRELALLDRYLDIMRVRFGTRLHVGFDIATGTEAALVPNLALQPIVENAIRYAVAPREAGGRIDITAERVGDRLLIRVRDDGPGPGGGGAPAGQGMGLRNVRERLAELYGGAQHLQLSSAPDGPGTVVEIALPFPRSPA